MCHVGVGVVVTVVVVLEETPVIVSGGLVRNKSEVIGRQNILKSVVF